MTTHTTSECEGETPEQSSETPTTVSENWGESNDEAVRPPLLSSLDPRHLRMQGKRTMGQ
jgi:hypothetical protein